MASKPINVCMIGHRFMGRAHANAYLKLDKFFDPPVVPVMHTVVGRSPADVAEFAKRWGWQRSTVDWKNAITNPEIGLVDVGTPNNQHRDMAIAALEAGKHVLCEKPLAATLKDAREMRDAARKAKKCKTFVSYSYRRQPAVAFAYHLAREGKLGRIYHVRATFLQGWASSPDIPLVWRFDKAAAGSGSHGDLGAHVIDMARFITGDEITEVTGAISETFVKERTLLSAAAGGAGIVSGAKASKGKKGKVQVDDAVLFLGKFSKGAVATFESTRFATGNENKIGLEINGEKGSIYYNYEDANNLHFFDATAPRRLQGWTTIQTSVSGEHPYVDHWWPTSHHLGYEHTFINQAYDMMLSLGGKKPQVPLADFEDAYKTQQVLEAATLSAKERGPIKISDMK